MRLADGEGEAVRTTNFDAIATATPLNREASTVRDGSGDLWSAKIKFPERHWSAPPPPLAKRPKNVADKTGVQIDRLRVVQYHGRAPNRAHLWLVRCACGDYELRRDKFVTTRPVLTEGNEHACQACDYLRKIKWHAKNAGSGLGRMKEDAALLDRIAAGERP